MKNNSVLKLFLFFLVFVLMQSFSCRKKNDVPIWVYKTKHDYSKLVSVELSKDKSKIVAFPGPNDLNEKWPVKLINGYFLNGTFGQNSGYLSLSIEEYNTHAVALSPDSLYKLLIDKDPFECFYERYDNDNLFRDEYVPCGIDTTFINNLIKNGELDVYFNKLK